MSLGIALDMTMRGLLATTSKLTIVSQNITNAGKAGYTRKEGTDEYVLTNSGSVPVKTNIVGSTDRYLTKQVVGDVSAMGKASAISEIMEYYGTQLGSTDGSTMSSYVNDLYGDFQQLSVTPETLANRNEAVQDAANLTAGLRDLSGTIQQLRGQADQKISDNVNSINADLDKLAQLNGKILSTNSPDAQSADYEDQRMATLEDLGKLTDIQYYFTAQNQVQVYTTSGQPLLLDQAKHLSYTPTSPVTAVSTFQPILLNGTDVTSGITGGSLAGNISVRDSILPGEQDKLDSFANTLSTQMNTILNKGASLPPQSTMTGATRGLTSATAFSATGNLRVAIVDNNGNLKNYSDLDLSTMASVGDVVTALNAIPNISASLDADGALKITSTLAGSGVSLNEMNSSVGPSSQGASLYFGMQNMFTGTSASTIDVSDYLKNNPTLLSSGQLNSGAIAVGDNVVTRGDGTTSLAMAQILKSNVPFSAAGDFASQNNTLSSYIEAIIADGATKSKIASDQYDTANSIYTQTKNTLNNESGVNIDEETTKMLSLQNSYQASARMISTIRDLFQDLMNAVS